MGILGLSIELIAAAGLVFLLARYGRRASATLVAAMVLFILSIFLHVATALDLLPIIRDAHHISFIAGTVLLLVDAVRRRRKQSAAH